MRIDQLGMIKVNMYRAIRAEIGEYASQSTRIRIRLFKEEKQGDGQLFNLLVTANGESIVDTRLSDDILTEQTTEIISETAKLVKDKMGLFEATIDDGHIKKLKIDEYAKLYILIHSELSKSISQIDVRTSLAEKIVMTEYKKGYLNGNR